MDHSVLLDKDRNRTLFLPGFPQPVCMGILVSSLTKSSGGVLAPTTVVQILLVCLRWEGKRGDRAVGNGRQLGRAWVMLVFYNPNVLPRGTTQNNRYPILPTHPHTHTHTHTHTPPGRCVSHKHTHTLTKHADIRTHKPTTTFQPCQQSLIIPNPLLLPQHIH